MADDSNNRLVKPEELNQIVHEHASWVWSEGKSGRQANLSGRAFGNQAELSKRNLSMADLSGAKLDRVDLSGSDLRKASLANASLKGANLRDANLRGADLRGANLEGADLRGATFHESDLTGAHLTRASASGASLRAANLSQANLYAADLNQTDVNSANLTRARFEGTSCGDADLRDTVGLELDNTFIRGARFSPVSLRGWALVCNLLFPALAARLEKWGTTRLAARLRKFRPKRNDAWSVLRQTYSGPRLIFLLLFLGLFAIPYVGRAVFWGTVSAVEPRLIREAEKLERAANDRLAALRTKVAALSVDRDRTVRLRAAAQIASLAPSMAWAPVALTWAEGQVAKTREAVLAEVDVLQAEVERWGRTVREGAEKKSVISVVLHWDRGLGSSIIAGLLLVYNLGVYVLITGVSALRDEEERSGYSPAKADYRHLKWIHRVVTVLFYVSLVGFFSNLADILDSEVYVWRKG